MYLVVFFRPSVVPKEGADWCIKNELPYIMDDPYPCVFQTGTRTKISAHVAENGKYLVCFGGVTGRYLDCILNMK